MMNIPRYYLLVDYMLHTQTPWVQNDKDSIISDGFYNSTIPTKNLRDMMKEGVNKFNYEEENRLPAVSILSGNFTELQLVANFTQTFGIVNNRQPQYMAYADYGLIPFAFFPTSVSSNIRNQIKAVLSDTGLTVYDKPAIYCHNIKSYRQYSTDVWLSRLEVAEWLKVKPEQIKTLDLFKGVMQV